MSCSRRWLQFQQVAGLFSDRPPWLPIVISMWSLRPQMGAAMKTYSRYQNGYLYEEHGAWYVRYRQRVHRARSGGEDAERDRRTKTSKRILPAARIKLWRRS